MTERPTYLDALARVAGWERPPDEGSDSARPRPRSRFEPDGSDPSAAEVAWGETGVQTEPSPPATAPTPSHADGAAGVHPMEPQPTARNPQPPAPTAEPAPPPAAEPARPMPSLAAPQPETTPGSDGPPPPLELPEPAGHPALPVPVTVPRETRSAQPATAAPAPQPEPTGEHREPRTLQTVAEPADRPDPTPRHEPAPAPEATHEARPVARPVEPGATEDPATREPQVDPGPTIVVEIGRIEVRLASDEGTAPRPTQTRPAPGPSLADYLRDRSAGAGRTA